jgi:archaellum component FlaC
VDGYLELLDAVYRWRYKGASMRPAWPAEEHLVSDGQETLIQALAQSMAKDQKVLLVEPSFELLSLMAMSPVKELVIITPDADPDAPAGETGTGAPLRMRPDYAERPRSKDLVIDPRGAAPVDAIERVLKKHGVYLTIEENGVTDHLPVVESIHPDLYGMAFVGGAPSRAAIKTKEHQAVAGAPIIAAARLALDSMKCSYAVDMNAAIEAETLRESIAAISAQLTERDGELAAIHGDLDQSTKQVEALHLDLEELKTAFDGASSTAEHSKREISELRSELNELENDYEKVRTDLAEQRVGEQREHRVKERVEETQRELTAEIELLRARLIKLDGPAADLSAVLAERDALRAALAASTRGCHDIARILLSAKAVPAPPVAGAQPAQAAALDAWLKTLSDRAEAMNTRQIQREATLRSVRSQSTRLKRKLQLVETTKETPPPPMLKVSIGDRLTEDKTPEIEGLEAALEAERTLRRLAEQRSEATQLSAQQAIQYYGELREVLIQTRRDKSESDVAQVIAEERLEQVRSELHQRAMRMAELEAMLATHHQLHGVMADTVREAEASRDEADTARRLAEANLDVLRGEFERVTEASDSPQTPRA